MQPGQGHGIALPRPSRECLYGSIYCSRCEFFGLGYYHPEWCTWQWLKESGAVQHSLDLIELGPVVSNVLIPRIPYLVAVRISVEPSDEDEPRLQVDRLLRGRLDLYFVATIGPKRRTS